MDTSTKEDKDKNVPDDGSKFVGQVIGVIPRRSKTLKTKVQSGLDGGDEDDEIFVTPQASFSRQLRINKTIDETSNLPPKTQIRDTKIQFMSNAISVIMLLASNETPDPKRLKIAKDYLGTITDDFGQQPPNVRGILNHIMRLEKGKDDTPTTMVTTVKAKFPTEEGGEEGDKKEEGDEGEKEEKGDEAPPEAPAEPEA